MRLSPETSWLIVCGTLVGLCVTFPLVDTDIWWHLASGRWIVEHTAVPRTDPFSLSAQGIEWIDIHWLFQLGVFAIHQLCGITGIVIGKSLLSAIGAVLLVKTVEENAGPSVRGLSTLWVLSAVIAGRWLVLARPVIITLLFLAIFLWVLERYRRLHDGRILFALPVLQVIWANCQGLHPLGPAVLTCYLAGDITQRWLPNPESGRVPATSLRALALTLLGCVVAPLVNPYGWHGWTLPWKLFGRINPELSNVFASHVSENLAPWQHHRLVPEQTTPFFLFAILVLGTFLLNRTRLQLRHLLVTLAFLLLASMAVRNVLLFYWIGAPMGAMNLAAYIRTGRASRLIGIAERARLGWIATAFLAVIVIHTWYVEPSISQPAPFRTPDIAVNLLAKSPKNSRLFCSVRYGGYLSWKLPHLMPFIDGRLVLRTAEQFSTYLRVLDEPERFDAFQAQHQFDFAVLPTALPDRYLRLVQHLFHHPDWHLIGTDGTETVFAHNKDGPGQGLNLGDRAVVSSLRDELQRRFDNAPQIYTVALHNLASLLITADQLERARELLAPMHDAISRILLARCYYLDGDTRFAGEIAHQVVKDDPHNVDGLYLLAVAAFDQRDPVRAIELVGRILEIDPYHAEATEMLDQLQRNR